MSITTRFPKIPDEQITPVVAELLQLVQLQMDEIQFLRDEIARFKGVKSTLSSYALSLPSF
jgi:hypothetical protein